MHEFDRGLESSVRRRRAGQGGNGWPFPGRHEMHAEIEDETPIFHALTVGGWRERQRGGASGRAVRRVHRGTVRTTPRRSGAGTADAVAAFHTEPAVPAPAGPGGRPTGRAAAEPGDAALAMLRRRRDAERAADRAAIADLLGGAGRHRLSHSA
ncbi:hypothetical protein ACLFMI_06255 [Pseudonocardia nantongensis]|uniref:hypothetical protein n=1 Tax=Pseudonocardia nantongensis TaxID=1181885 RepID=UPI0039783B9F